MTAMTDDTLPVTARTIRDEMIAFGIMTALLAFGHAMFLGTAGYVTAHALKVWGLTPELGILVGTAAAAGLGVVTGLVAIRRQGIYFAMITLALSPPSLPVCNFHPAQFCVLLLPHPARLPVRLPAYFPHHQLAVRRCVEGDP